MNWYLLLWYVYAYQHFLFDFPFDEIYRRTYYVPDAYIRMIRTLCSRYIRMYLVSAGRNLYVRTLCFARGRTRPTWGPRRPVRGLLSSLSRTKRRVDLMVEPMSFDRIGNLGNSSTMKAWLQEEVRLVELAQSTRGRYTDMGVFSAVAGNQ